MTETRMLQPHDPLPDGPAVILMRRFEEDAPTQVMMELIVIRADQTETNSRLLDEGGEPMSWEAAEARAGEAATAAGLHVVHRVDRTDGTREREILAHDGDRSVDGEGLDDDDLEEGEAGSDMRDNALKSAPRNF